MKVSLEESAAPIQCATVIMTRVVTLNSPELPLVPLPTEVEASGSEEAGIGAEAMMTSTR